MNEDWLEHSASDNTPLRSVLRLHNPFRTSKELKMRKKLVIALLSIIPISEIFGISDFTIMAISGLNMREKPALDSKKIAAIPFGTIVQAEENYETFQRQEEKATLEIEGRKGYWLKIKYDLKEGYVFSGFTLMGKWVVQSEKGLNNQYRILQEGYYCDPINYSPKLNWYAIINEENTTTFKKVNIRLRLKHEYTEDEEIENEIWGEFPIKIETDIEKASILLLGTEDELNLSSQSYPRILNMKDDMFDHKEGIFFYPEQFVTMYLKPFEYKIGAREKITLAPNEANGYKREYRFLYRYRNGKKNYEYDLSDDLQLYGSGELHSNYQTPKLIWAGDINGDKMMDLIIYSHTMTDSGGVCWDTHLFISNKEKEIPIKKVAGNTQCNCIS